MAMAIETPSRLFGNDACLTIKHENVATSQDKTNINLKNFIFGVMPTN